MAVGTKMNKTQSPRRRQITFQPGEEKAKRSKQVRAMQGDERSRVRATFLICSPRRAPVVFYSICPTKGAEGLAMGLGGRIAAGVGHGVGTLLALFGQRQTFPGVPNQARGPRPPNFPPRAESGRSRAAAAGWGGQRPAGGGGLLAGHRATPRRARAPLPRAPPRPPPGSGSRGPFLGTNAPIRLSGALYSFSFI